MQLRGEFRCHHQENPFSLFWETAKSSQLSFVREFSNRYVRPDAAQKALGWLLSADGEHSAHIGSGREGLFDLIKNTPATLKWEHGIILAQDDLCHRRQPLLGQRIASRLDRGRHCPN